MEPAEGPTIWYYTSLQTAVAHILPSWTLQLSPLSSMRDPRESQLWVPAFGAPIAETKRLRERFKLAVEQLQARVKILSLVIDDTANPPWSRGWVQPRMWEQYGDCFRGVCFGFDREELSRIATRQLSKIGLVMAGPIRYEDEAIELGIDQDAAASGDPAQLLDDALTQNLCEELLFTKLRGWGDEHEFRIAVVATDTAELRPKIEAVAPALKKVVIGFESAGAAMPIGLWLRNEAPSVELEVLWWVNGHPAPEPIWTKPA